MNRVKSKFQIVTFRYFLNQARDTNVPDTDLYRQRSEIERPLRQPLRRRNYRQVVCLIAWPLGTQFDNCTKQGRGQAGRYVWAGQPVPVIPHRRKGIANKITRDIKHGVIEAAVRHGRDGKGAGGLIGFFRIPAAPMQ